MISISIYLPSVKYRMVRRAVSQILWLLICTDPPETRGVFRSNAKQCFFHEKPGFNVRGTCGEYWYRRAQVLHIHALREGVDSDAAAGIAHFSLWIFRSWITCPVF